MEELIDGDVVKLTLLRATHSRTFSEGYDDVLGSFLQDLGQAPRWSACGGGIGRSERWPEQSRERKTLQGAGEHRGFGTKEGLFGDPGQLS